MSPDDSEPGRGSVTGILWLVFTATLAVTVADMLLPAHLTTPILYILPMIAIARLENLRALWGFTAVVTLLTLLHVVLRPPTVQAFLQPMLVNRGLATLVLLAASGLLHLQLRAPRSMGQQREHLLAQNRELEAANEEIGQREEEIARQNEELQSQTEELERQAEELRVTNEDLAAREKTVEQLLELSRSLTSDLSRDLVLRKVCDALGVLTAGVAAAILERQDDALKVTCVQGFGTEIEAAEIPNSQSFSHLVMSAGQTAFLEDIRQRPDLVIPQPKSGERFVSVLSTPIRVFGNSMGTLEVYAHAPQRWSDAQVNTLESVAAQISISLQNAALLGELDAQRRRFEAAFRSVPVGMLLVLDADGKEVRVNPAGALLLGVALDDNLSASSAAGARLLRGIFKDGRAVPAEEMPISRALRGEDVSAEAVELLLPNARRLSLAIGAAPFLDADGKVTGAVAVFLDETAHKTLLREVELRRREAEEASVRKTRFLAAVSHDIRTPANAINLTAELIRRAVENAELAKQMPEMAQRLQVNVRSLLDLVQDLLDLSRFDSGKAEILETEFSLNELLEEEGHQFLPTAAGRGLTLEIEPSPRPIWLRTDRVKLGRIITNLIENAIKFTPHGSVKVSATLIDGAPGAVEISVSDTGVGIAADQLTRIFDEFLQLRNPQRDSARGSGLGLAICKRLVGLLGGELRVSSVPERGSTFTVELPASDLAPRLGSLAPTRPHRPPGPPRLPGLRVVVIEDHASTRIGIRDLLEQEGAIVREAPSGAAGITLMGDEPSDVLLLDLMLPDMDGTEVLKTLRSMPRRPRGVMVLSGDLGEERLRDLKALGPDAVVQKPVDTEVLVLALQVFHRSANLSPNT
ncbi:MAG: ATP-binding protein [Candidatus Eisenbacteria bacterium]